jgi:activator of HSP90 ATPase
MMNEIRSQAKSANVSTRRQAIAGTALAFGSLTATSILRATPSQQAMKETPSTAASQNRTSLHQDIDLKAAPQRLYEILLDSKQFAAFTGMPAEIDPKAGGAFSMFGAMIVGRNIELIPNQRIVQAWRPASWAPGVYSIVKFELKAKGTETTLVLDHTGFPQGDFDHLDPGWKMRYWDPLKKYLS